MIIAFKLALCQQNSTIYRFRCSNFQSKTQNWDYCLTLDENSFKMRRGMKRIGAGGWKKDFVCQEKPFTWYKKSSLFTRKVKALKSLNCSKET